MANIMDLILKEEIRQKETLMMIPSENYTYSEVREAVGSVLMHKYSEGYPGRRYYQGNSIIDEIETAAINQAKELFGVPHVNVQALSGSPANTAVLFGLCDQNDLIMGMDLASGGHLTHGHPKITFSGKYFHSIQYGVDESGYIDFDNLQFLAKKHSPKLIIAGTTAYPRELDWERFSWIAESVGAFLLADISHIAGLVVSNVHPSPVPYAHIVTTTTHKTLRGPRGALILVTDRGLLKDAKIGSKIDKAVFPGLQGGPHNNTTAGIAITLQKASTNEFLDYGQQIVANSKELAKILIERGFNLVTNGTDNHLVLIDLRNKKILGKDAAIALEKAGIIVNANAIPFDTNPPMNPSGIRLGTPAITARGMKEDVMPLIASWISRAIDCAQNEPALLSLASEVRDLLKKYPIE